MAKIVKGIKQIEFHDQNIKVAFPKATVTVDNVRSEDGTVTADVVINFGIKGSMPDIRTDAVFSLDSLVPPPKKVKPEFTLKCGDCTKADYVPEAGNFCGVDKHHLLPGQGRVDPECPLKSRPKALAVVLKDVDESLKRTKSQ